MNVSEKIIVGLEEARIGKKIPLPTVDFEELYHVGSLDPKDKGTGSYEGVGLSVSLHPEEWMEIARIGGTTWELTKQGNSFLDYYGLSDEHKEQILRWGLKRGLVESSTIYRVTYYDSEYDEERYMDFFSRKEADEEAELLEEDAKVEVVPGSYRSTFKLKKMTRNAPGDALGALTPVYVEHETRLDGVWWDEELDTSRLSAPRGVIVPARLKEWKIERGS